MTNPTARRIVAVPATQTPSLITAPTSGGRPIRSTTLADLCHQSIDARAFAATTAARMHAITRAMITPFFGNRAATSVTRDDVTAWITWLTGKRAYSPRSVHTALRLLSSTTTWAMRTGILTIDPCQGVPHPQLPKPVPPQRTPDPGHRSPIRAATNGTAHGHCHRIDPLSQLCRAIRDGDLPNHLGLTFSDSALTDQD